MKYYKQRNGNEIFGYEISYRLKRIEDLISANNENFICGIFSAIISSCLTNYIENTFNHLNENFVFIIILGLLYFIIKLSLNSLRKIFIILKAIKYSKYIPEEQEEELIDCFYSKIANELILAISLINRVEHLQAIDKKKELQKIYLYQAKHSIEKTSRFLHEHIANFTDAQLKEYSQLIGEPSMQWLIDTAICYLEKYNDIFDIFNPNNTKDKISDSYWTNLRSRFVSVCEIKECMNKSL